MPAFEAAAYQTADLTHAMAADGQPVNHIRVDGGMVVNDWFCQALANMTGATIDRPKVTETTAHAALLAAWGQSCSRILKRPVRIGSWIVDLSPNCRIQNAKNRCRVGRKRSPEPRSSWV